MSAGPQEQWHVVATLPPQQPLPASPRQRATTPRRLAVIVAVSLAASVGVAGGVRALQSEPAHSRLGAGALVEVPGGSYSFGTVLPDGAPVRWNPCEPIRYVANLQQAPPGAAADLRAAIAQLASATGIRFVDEGESDEAPVRVRAAYQPDRYGDRWAPVLVAWAHLAEVGVDHTAETVGVATPSAVSRGGGTATYVSAQVVLTAARALQPGFGSADSQGGVLMHEMAHALGLGHTPDELQVMYDGTARRHGAAEWGSGDLAGLRALGREAGCLRTPPPGFVD